LFTTVISPAEAEVDWSAADDFHGAAVDMAAVPAEYHPQSL
jgi:hypothetical protein